MKPPERGRRVRVVVWLDTSALERLETIVHHRHGARSRSAVVRDAVGWLLAREAAWLLRQEAATAQRLARAADLQAALEIPRPIREQAEREQTIAAALDVVHRTPPAAD